LVSTGIGWKRGCWVKMEKFHRNERARATSSLGGSDNSIVFAKNSCISGVYVIVI
jgi:hypothetical protein